MDLSALELDAVRQGEPVCVTIPEVAVECVLVRADVFRRLSENAFDDGLLTSPERLAALQEAGRRADWDDPALDVYEEHRAQK